MDIIMKYFDQTLSYHLILLLTLILSGLTVGCKIKLDGSGKCR